MIDEATKQRILDAAKIEEVVGDFVTLRRRGVNLIGLCPFHNKKHLRLPFLHLKISASVLVVGKEEHP